jgi:protocatechuate 3,4-dioxygenase beta subunit
MTPREQLATPVPRTGPDEISATVLASFDACPEPRLREVMQALVRHLHAFAVETRLTEQEWARAIAELTATGHITDDVRQEFVLWSDTLGLSMIVDALSHPRSAAATESTVLGPFYAPGSPLRAYGESMMEAPAGLPALVHGRVLGADGAPIAGAELDVWQNGDNRLYAVQDTESDEDHLRGRYRTNADGAYAFVGVRPVPYTIPSDGPVGQMLDRTGRHPWRPAHIHMIVSADGYQSLTTHIFDADSAYLDSDAVFAVKPSLLREFVLRRADDPERPAGIDGEWCSVENEIRLDVAGL